MVIGRAAPPVAPRRVPPRVMRDALGDHPVLISGKPGHWLVRLVPGGPSMPARVYYVRTEPGDPSPLLDDLIERPIETWAEIGGRACSPEEVWARQGTPITARQYEAAMSEIETARFAGRYDPRLYPREPIDAAALPPPVFERV